MEWKVAPSYVSADIIKVDETVKKAYIKMTCPRCGGRGLFITRVENGKPIPTPVDGGVCYECGGTGSISKWVKAYTPEEFEKYVAAQKRSRERKDQERERKLQEKLRNSDINRKERLESWGYDPENPLIYLIGGGSTYEIKDQLKEMGCKFNPALGWFSNHEIDLPDGYKTVTIKFEDAYEWIPAWTSFELKDTAKSVAGAALATLMPESHSEWIGEVKERLRDMEVTFTGARQFEGAYGTTFIYSFLLNEKDVFTWFTSSCKDLVKGNSYLLTGTVKKFDEYNGVKSTVLSRCIIKEVA